MSAIFKYNSGNGAILCSKCSRIIRSGNSLTEDDWKHGRGEIILKAQYCNKCKDRIKNPNKYNIKG